MDTVETIPTSIHDELEVAKKRAVENCHYLAELAAPIFLSQGFTYCDSDKTPSALRLEEAITHCIESLGPDCTRSSSGRFSARWTHDPEDGVLVTVDFSPYSIHAFGG